MPFIARSGNHCGGIFGRQPLNAVPARSTAQVRVRMLVIAEKSLTYIPNGLYTLPSMSAPGVIISPASTVELCVGNRTSTFTAVAIPM